jgi:hypothetical protein
LKPLRETIDRLTLDLSAAHLFALPPIVCFEAEAQSCPVCKTALKVQKSKTRTLATLAIGDFRARETTSFCPRCHLVCGSKELSRLAAKGAKFGYDVLVYVGRAFFLRCRNGAEIVEELEEKNIGICSSEVYYLARKFILYLALAHKRVEKKTGEFLALHGGYILHLDGTCEGASPHLISALDGISEVVLDNVKMPSESSEQLIPFLKEIKKTYGNPLAVVSDLSQAIIVAVKEVFGRNIRHLLCHFHFLRDLGKDLFEAENEVLRTRLRKHRVQEILRKTVRSLEALIGSPLDLVAELTHGMACEPEKVPGSLSADSLPAAATRLLILWALEGKCCRQGYGFPLDQPYLLFYQRVEKLAAVLRELGRIELRENWKDNRIYGKVLHDLLPVFNDPLLAKEALRMQQKVEVFNRLRAAMRIALPQRGPGLNDSGDRVKINTIEQRVRTFRDRLEKNLHRLKDKEYQTMLVQLDKYWGQLFADPIVVSTKAGTLSIQPQRTNNILEQLFRAMARRYRRKSGFNSMEKTIKAMLADTPLVKNLEHKEYLSVLLDQRSSLEELFAEIDARQVREQIRKLQNSTEPLSPQMKKIFRASELPEAILALFDRHRNHLSRDASVEVIHRQTDTSSSQDFPTPAVASSQYA